MDKNKLERLAHNALMDDIALTDAKERAAESKAALEAALVEEDMFNQDTKAIGDARLKIVPNNYFDISTATQFLTKRALKECTVPTVDPKLVKNHLTPPQLAAAMKSYPKAFKLGLSVLEDE